MTRRSIVYNKGVTVTGRKQGKRLCHGFYHEQI